MPSALRKSAESTPGRLSRKEISNSLPSWYLHQSLQKYSEERFSVQVGVADEFRLGLEAEECVVQHVVVNVHLRHLWLHSFPRFLLHGFLILLLLVCLSDARDPRGCNKLWQRERRLFNATLALQIPAKTDGLTTKFRKHDEARSLALVAPVAGNRHGVASACGRVRPLDNMNESTSGAPLRCTSRRGSCAVTSHASTTSGFSTSCFNSATLGHREGEQIWGEERDFLGKLNAEHMHSHLKRLISFLRLLLRLFSSGAEGGSGTLLALASIRSTASTSKGCSSSLGKKCSKTPFQCS